MDRSNRYSSVDVGIFRYCYARVFRSVYYRVIRRMKELLRVVTYDRLKVTFFRTVLLGALSRFGGRQYKGSFSILRVAPGRYVVGLGVTCRTSSTWFLHLYLKRCPYRVVLDSTRRFLSGICTRLFYMVMFAPIFDVNR